MSVFAWLGIFVELTFGVSQVFAAPPSMDTMPESGVYVNSEGSPLLPLLKNARKSIDIEIYTIQNPTVRTLLREAIARDVKIRIIKEPNPVGDRCNLFDEPTPEEKVSKSCTEQKKFLKEVRAAGGVFEPFNKKGLCPKRGKQEGSGCFQHGKIVLADGIALVSTGNFDSTNLCLDRPSACNRDYTLILDDSLVYKSLHKLFEADLLGKTYDVRSLIPKSLKETLTVSPRSQTPLLNLIKSARVSIDLEAQYLKEPGMNEALQERSREGVKVSVTVASPCTFGLPSTQEAKAIEAVYTEFDDAGISTRMFNSTNRINGKRGYMHAKAIVIDGTRAWVGSENGSQESLKENREYGFIFDEAAWVKTLLKTVQADHKNPATETWQQSLECKKERPSASKPQPEEVEAALF